MEVEMMFQPKGNVEESDLTAPFKGARLVGADLAPYVVAKQISKV